MSLEDQVVSTIDALYAASLDETLWPQALRSLTKLTRSQGASFWVLDSSEPPRLPVFTVVDFDPKFISDYLAEMVPMDPTVQYLVRHPDCEIVHDGLVITDAEKERNAYYDWQRRHSDIHYRMVGQARPAPPVQAGVALHRVKRAGRFESGDIERFALLHRHLTRALTTGYRLGTLESMRRCTTELLDRNSSGIVLLDEHRRVVYRNRAAQQLCAENDGIRFAAENISLAHKRDHDQLQALIAQALSPVFGSRGGTMRAQRPSLKRAYSILITRISREYPLLTAIRPVVCICITDPGSANPMASDRFKIAFGLTDAEARLAALLASGEDLRGAAARLQITYGTARTRLASIFFKTETRRQGELIRLLLAIPRS